MNFFWTDPIALLSFRMSSPFTRSVFCCWCWKCCAEAIDKNVLSPRTFELWTLCVCDTRDNHYAMVTLWKVSLSPVRWLCNMLVVDVKPVSSNGLLATTPVPIIYTSLDYQAGLVKRSRFALLMGKYSFPFGSFLLSFTFSYRYWSSLAKPTRKFWKLCDNAKVKCRLGAYIHVKTTTHLRGLFTNDTLSVSFV